MKKATKLDLVKAIAKRHRRYTYRLTTEIINQFFDVTIRALRRKGRIELRDFGVFFVVELPARVGRNPKTGEPVDIPAQKHVRFKMSNRMRDWLNR